jgi:hypothetical protein
MMSHGEKAKAIRQYFIEVEKKYYATEGGKALETLHALARTQETLTEMLKGLIDRAAATDRKIEDVKAYVNVIGNRTCEIASDYTAKRLATVKRLATTKERREWALLKPL